MSAAASSVQRITAALPPDAVPEIVLDADFDRIEVCRSHYEQVGLGADYVDRLIR